MFQRARITFVAVIAFVAVVALPTAFLSTSMSSIAGATTADPVFMFSRYVDTTNAYSNPERIYDIYEHHADGSNEKLTNAATEEGADQYGGYGYVAPVPSRDGTRVLALRAEGSSQELFVITIATGAVTGPISSGCHNGDGEFHVNSADWLPNGHAVFTGHDWALSYTVAADGTGCTPMAHQVNGGDVTVSPNGARLAFTGADGIWVSKLDGSSARRVAASGSEPAWSPDSSKLAVTTGGGSIATFTVPTSGLATPTVVAGTSGGSTATWRPDGAALLYAGASGIATSGSGASLTAGNDLTPRFPSMARPRTTVTSPTAIARTGLPFAVSWAAAGAHTFKVEWAKRTLSGSSWVTGAWSTWKAATTATHATFGNSSAPTTVAAGTTYLFRTTARDAFGNQTAISAVRRATVAFDDGAGWLSYGTGWVAQTGASGRWLGTLHHSGTAGASVHGSTSASSFTVIGDRCSGCGSFKIYIDGSYRGTVSTYAASNSVRRVLWQSASLGATASHTLRIVVVGTSGHPKVALDGVAAAR